jgi:hypothetical protein
MRTIAPLALVLALAAFASSSQPSEPVVELTNSRWSAVNVEVRRGTESDCGLNAAFETRELDRGETWAIPVPQGDLCYRRDRDPDHPNGEWSSWRRVPPSGARTHVHLR